MLLLHFKSLQQKDNCFIAYFPAYTSLLLSIFMLYNTFLLLTAYSTILCPSFFYCFSMLYNRQEYGSKFQLLHSMILLPFMLHSIHLLCLFVKCLGVCYYSPHSSESRVISYMYMHMLHLYTCIPQR